MDVFAKIDELRGGSMVFGTERTRQLLDSLGSPDDHLKIVHIAGTNGKGSIAAYITGILVAADKKTGTFTSPAVMDYFEQFKIDGKPIERDLLSRYFSVAYENGKDCTAFEVQTAGALYAFAREGCEYAVVECGLGGLTDSTNAIRHKELAVISSIGLEHTAILGDTIAKICAQKAGIIKDCPAVVNALQPQEAREFFAGKGVIFADKRLEVLESTLQCQRFVYDGDEYEIGMIGPAQVYNAATAIEAAKVLGLPQNAIRGGISSAKLPGRVQILCANGNTYIVDGAHNPASFAPLVSVLKGIGKRDATLIFGCLSDKDIGGDLKALNGFFTRVIAVQPKSVRAMELQKIASAAERYFKSVEVAESVSEALNKCNGTVVVCGSFTLVKEAVNWIEKES